MKIKKVEFIKSSSRLEECPKSYYPEIALIGRSNVGKSSLINMICDNKKLAKVSETPGKTKTINHFLVNGNWYLVDLPGYGYAKTSRSEKEQFQQIIPNYISKRETLLCTMILIDSRLEFQNIDKEFIIWITENALPFAIVLTKIDKLSKNELSKQIKHFETELAKMLRELPNIFLTSSINKTGRKELLEFFEYLIELNKNKYHCNG